MIRAIACFELRYQLRGPLFWVVTGFLFLLTFGATATRYIVISDPSGRVLRNAPFATVHLLAMVSLFCLFLTTVFVARAILRDFDRGTAELVFSRPVPRLRFLLGRFLGGYLVSVSAYLGAVAGHMAGCLMPSSDPQQVSTFLLSPYVWALLVIALPNLFFCAAVFFSVASMTRSLAATFTGIVVMIITFQLARVLVGHLDQEHLASFLDPFALATLSEATKYWTIVERNRALPELGGVILLNRLLWMGVSLAALALPLTRFRYSFTGSEGRRKKVPATDAAGPPSPPSAPPALPRLAPTMGFATTCRQFWHRMGVDALAVLKSIPFLFVLTLSLISLIVHAILRIEGFGKTPVYPVTYLMLETIKGWYQTLLLIIIIFFSGQLIWRERSLRLNQLCDAMPVPNGVFLAAKMVAQFLVVTLFAVIGILTTIGVQAFYGYYHFELLVYAQGFVFLTLGYLLLSVLASFVQVVAGNKYLGWVLMIVYLISPVVMAHLHWNHYLYRFPQSPAAPYSDMNGWGPFVAPFVWLKLYWIFAAAIMTGLAVLFWVRGTDPGWKARLRVAVRRLRGPVRVVLAVAVAGFVATGAWIFYNTNVLNDYLPRDRINARLVEYEKKYRRYRDADLPRITEVRVEVDVFPHQRRVEARGRYLCVNRNAAPLAEIHLTIPWWVTVNALDLPPHTLVVDDEELGYRIYRLDQPLAPGEKMELDFDLTVSNPGFRNDNFDTSIVRNGTFFHNQQYFPSFGYNARWELGDRDLRRKNGLPPPQRMARVDDPDARRNTFLATDSDWIRFETTVSTRADQIAIAPGYLQKEWTAGDRRYFHYQMDAPILNFYAYLSAAYQVRRVRWRDVAIEIYYHEPHTYNLDRMIDAVKKTLAYCSENFGPYQHRQLRIVEFPRYRSIAQSFPTTVPFSEGIGFIARLGDETNAIDFPFYVTAHEVAHQWWAHQVIGGNVEGSFLISEGLAQYSALMVMEHEYGKEKMRRFLKYELDGYLRHRGQEEVEEMPLYRVEGQPYIFYSKGSVVMYSLREAIGEAALNRALAAYVAAVAFQPPPFTNSLELLDFVRREVPADRQALITDLFETITLFENRVERARFAQLLGGKYSVAVEARARKLRSDGYGVESEIPLDDWIEIGVFGEREVDGRSEETVLYLDQRHVTEAEVRFVVVVDELPVRAGIDPFNKLVDRNSDDNCKRVKETTPAEIPLDETAG